jgi:phosphoribosylformylglycinamidine synthase
MSDACIALGTPVVSGNVSFYNQTGETAINPTPTVGAVGLLEDCEKLVSQYFSEEGDSIIVLGETFAEIGGSEYLSVIHGLERGAPPKVDLVKEAALQRTLIELADKRLVKSMHDISDGGLGVALMECCFKPGTSAPLGFEVSLATKLRPDLFFFSETQSRVIVSCNPAKAKDILETAKENGVPAVNAGKTSSGNVEIMVGGRVLVKTQSSTLKKTWSEALPNMMNSHT